MNRMATATVITSAQFLARPDEFDQNGNLIKEELIGGEIVKMAEPSTWHDVTKNNIGNALALHLAAHPELGFRSLIEIGFEVAPTDTFRPDVAVVRTKRLTQRRLVQGSPEIAIAVISPTDTADKIREKIAAYLKHGANSVWIFYRDGSVAVHTATGVRELKGDDRLENELLPGFSVPVSSLYFLPKSWGRPPACSGLSGRLSQTAQEYGSAQRKVMQKFLLGVAILGLAIPVFGDTIATATCSILFRPPQVVSDPISASCEQSSTSPLPANSQATAGVSVGSLSGSAQGNSTNDSAIAVAFASFDESLSVPTTITWSYSATASDFDTEVDINLAGLAERCEEPGSGGPSNCSGPIVQTLSAGDYTFSLTSEVGGEGLANGSLSIVSQVAQVPEPGTIALAASVLLLCLFQKRRQANPTHSTRRK